MSVLEKTHSEGDVMFDIVGKALRAMSLKKSTEMRATAHFELPDSNPIANPSSSKTVLYDEKLTDQLKLCHENLLRSYGCALKDGYLESNFELLNEHICEFKSQFQSHLLKENVKLYPYLDSFLRRDADSLLLLRESRQDMNNNASMVLDFCKKYEKAIFNQGIRDSFKADYHVTGHALVRRIRHQERGLYALYDSDF